MTRRDHARPFAAVILVLAAGLCMIVSAGARDLAATLTFMASWLCGLGSFFAHLGAVLRAQDARWVR